MMKVPRVSPSNGTSKLPGLYCVLSMDVALWQDVTEADRKGVPLMLYSSWWNSRQAVMRNVQKRNGKVKDGSVSLAAVLPKADRYLVELESAFEVNRPVDVRKWVAVAEAWASRVAEGQGADFAGVNRILQSLVGRLKEERLLQVEGMSAAVNPWTAGLVSEALELADRSGGARCEPGAYNDESWGAARSIEACPSQDAWSALWTSSALNEASEAPGEASVGRRREGQCWGRFFARWNESFPSRQTRAEGRRVGICVAVKSLSEEAVKAASKLSEVVESGEEWSSEEEDSLIGLKPETERLLHEFFHRLREAQYSEWEEQWSMEDFGFGKELKGSCLPAVWDSSLMLSRLLFIAEFCQFVSDTFLAIQEKPAIKIEPASNLEQVCRVMSTKGTADFLEELTILIKTCQDERKLAPKKGSKAALEDWPTYKHIAQQFPSVQNLDVILRKYLDKRSAGKKVSLPVKISEEDLNDLYQFALKADAAHAGRISFAHKDKLLEAVKSWKKRIELSRFDLHSFLRDNTSK